MLEVLTIITSKPINLFKSNSGRADGAYIPMSFRALLKACLVMSVKCYRFFLIILSTVLVYYFSICPQVNNSLALRLESFD